MELLKRYKLATIVLILFALAAIGLYIAQLIMGLTVTGMNNGTSWGTYITCFMFFVGLSAGGLIVASSASVFHIDKFKQVALPAIILSTVCICCAGMFILIDLGGIFRIWRILTGPNFLSPLLWDVCVITFYLVINIFYLRFMYTNNTHAISIVSRFALPVAILVHSVTAWIFGLENAKEGWYTAILAPIFVASAMDSGLALLLMVLAGLKKLKIFDTPKELLTSLAGLLCACIAVDGFFIGCELLTMAYPMTEAAQTILSELMIGPMAPFFWIEIGGGLIVPFCILIFERNRQRIPLVMVASALVVVGVFFKRIWLLFTSFITPNAMGAPGIISGSSAAAHATGVHSYAVLSSYAPTVFEIFIPLGVVAIGILGFLVLSSVLFRKAPQSSLYDSGASTKASQATVSPETASPVTVK